MLSVSTEETSIDDRQYYKNILATKIKFARVLSGESIASLAEKTNISRVKINNFEKNIGNLYIDEFLVLARFLQIDISHLCD